MHVSNLFYNDVQPRLAERIDLLRQVAETLAAAGIASLRYDKRGVGGSTPMPQGSLEEQQRFFAWENFAADVVAAHAERHGLPAAVHLLLSTNEFLYLD